MRKEKIQKLENVLGAIPDKKYPLVLHYLYWVRDYEDTLSVDEVRELQSARREKGGISWRQLKNKSND